MKPLSQGNNLRGREVFAKTEPFLTLLTAILSLLPRRVRLGLLRLCRNVPGMAGIGFRYCLVKTLAITSGPNVLIGEQVYLLQPQNLTIGRNVSIHPFSYIDAAGGITIGRDVSIAHAVTIMSTTHNYRDPLVPIKDQGVSSAFTNIQNDCWIGAKAVITAGISIGTGSVVGAGSVVTRDVPPYSVVAGCPARLISQRGEYIH